MEEEKAAAYYEELLRKGEGAARFKQGLGFSSNSNSNKSSTSFSIPTSLSNFVKQSSPNSAPAIQKESSIFNIRDKLKKRPDPEGRTRSKDRPDRIGIGERRTVDGRNGRSRSPSSSADENKRSSRRVGRSRSPYRGHHGRRRSFSPHSPSPYYRRRDRSESPRREHNSPERRRDGGRRRRSRSRSMGRGRSRSRSKSRSPGSRHIRDREYNKSRTKPSQQKPAERDYAKLIPNYETMTPAERVKAKMKLQLSETVVKDKEKGMTGEWERYDFDKNAPLDDDAKLDYFGDGTGARDDTSLIKNTGGSFLASSCQAKKEIKTQEAHEAAIFGIPMDLSTNDEDGSEDADANAFGNVKRTAKASSSVVSEQVIASQQESWQERARKLKAAREMASA